MNCCVGRCPTNDFAPIQYQVQQGANADPNLYVPITCLCLPQVAPNNALCDTALPLTGCDAGYNCYMFPIATTSLGYCCPSRGSEYLLFKTLRTVNKQM